MSFATTIMNLMDNVPDYKNGHVSVRTEIKGRIGMRSLDLHRLKRTKPRLTQERL